MGCGTETKSCSTQSGRKQKTPEETNPGIIEKLTGVPILGIVPHDDTIDTENGIVGNIVGLVKENVDLEPLIPE